MICVEYQKADQALAFGQTIDGYVVKNWLFDQVTGEPILEKFVQKASPPSEPEPSRPRPKSQTSLIKNTWALARGFWGQICSGQCAHNRPPGPGPRDNPGPCPWRAEFGAKAIAQATQASKALLGPAGKVHFPHSRYGH